MRLTDAPPAICVEATSRYANATAVVTASALINAEAWEGMPGVRSPRVGLKLSYGGAAAVTVGLLSGEFRCRGVCRSGKLASGSPDGDE